MVKYRREGGRRMKIEERKGKLQINTIGSIVGVKDCATVHILDTNIVSNNQLERKKAP
jgi:hypothetical protein